MASTNRNGTNRRWEIMKLVLQSAVLALLLAPSWLLSIAQVPAYVKVDVPFKFKIGARSFRAGHYEFRPKGVNLMALRDGRERVVASLTTRVAEPGAVAPATELVFYRQKKNLFLARIKIQDQSQALEILGEEFATPQSRPPSVGPTQILLFGDRMSVGMKQ